MKASARIALFVLIGPILTSLWGGCPQIGAKDSTESPLRVDAITPDSGPTTGGTRVTIRGGPFQDNVGVLFGSFAGVDPIIVNSRMITVLTPAQDVGVVNVSVLTDLGFVNVLGAFTYEAVPAPNADSIFPSSGPVSGGTEVTITGENFTDHTRVLFDQSPATNIRLVTPQILSVTTPPHAVGPVDVTLMNGSEQQVLDDGFNYESEAPVIDSLEPASGPIEGGTQVTIRGSNLPAHATIVIGSANVPATFLNSSTVTFITPSVAAPILVPISFLLEDGVDQIAGDFEYTSVVPYDDGTDTDGDGITDVQEQTGWEVWTEMFGLQLGVDTFGNVTRYSVTSDPNVADTDGDGIDDNVEMLIRSDPRKLDTDDDGLWDGEEWNQWLTSPTAVDTDADSRGDRNLQNAPNQALFDGCELFDPAVMRLPQGHALRAVRPRATSPTLLDTDGDGVGDFDEYDSTVRNGVISDLPRLEYELVGDVDVRLNVEYAETIGESREYGTTLTQSESTTVGSSHSDTIGWSLEVGIENEVKAAIFEYGRVTTSFKAGISGEHSWTSSIESSKESSEEHSRVLSDSREFTESSASGAVRTAILLRNAGNTTFTLDGLGVLVSQREKTKLDGDTAQDMQLKTIATMTPGFDTVTLAPGENAGPFELAANDVNAQAIKELLARPDTLLLGTAAMNFRDRSGMDFDFVREFTVAQTAQIVIDFGDGEVRSYNVATNVDRNPDSTYRGITLRRVFEEVLGLPFGDPENGYTTMVSELNDRMTLESLLGRRYIGGSKGLLSWWSVMVTTPAQAQSDLNDIVLHAGDVVNMFFERDDDLDGVSNTQEKASGSDQDPVTPGDADGDGLSDKEEVLDGWIAFEDPANPDEPHPDGFAKRRVYSDPRSPDADGDGLTDPEERDARSDPSDPDSDGDSLLDGQDPFPIRRAGIRFVKADAAAGGNGRTWDTAYTTIQQALANAAAGQATPALPDDDVAQIWVARGEYRPSSRLSPIGLLNNVGIYGGFSGPGANFAGETKRGQRLTNPFANGCVITGDLAGNDIGEIDLLAPGTRAENCPRIVAAPVGLNSSAVLDGFMITGAHGQPGDLNGALYVNSSPKIQNCLVFKNGHLLGAGIYVLGGSPVFKKCIVAENVAETGAGAYLGTNEQVLFEDCEFSQNEARLIGDVRFPVGGGVRVAGMGLAEFTRCSFVGNQAHNKGAGLYAERNAGYVRIDSCRFFNNLISGPDGGDWRGSGAGVFLDADAGVSNSVFWGNHSGNWGGAIVAFRRCTITNCTVAFNRVALGLGAGILTGTRNGNSGNVTIENTISWANWYGSGPAPDDSEYTENLNILSWDSALLRVSNSCFNAPVLYRGNNNIGEDPSFTGLELGDLGLGDQSPCIDRGNSFVDLDPLVPGLQQLPEFDFFGNPRIADGNGDGFTSVDVGAFEAQSQ